MVAGEDSNIGNESDSDLDYDDLDDLAVSRWLFFLSYGTYKTNYLQQLASRGTLK